MPPWIGSERFFSNDYDLHWLTALDAAAWRTFIRDQQARPGAALGRRRLTADTLPGL